MAESNQSIENKGTLADLEPDLPAGLRAPFPDELRIFALAVNFLLVAVALPVVLARPTSVLAAAWLVVPLSAAGLGVVLLRRHRRLSTWVLLYVFPVATGALVAAAPNFAAEPVFDVFTISLSAFSFVLYGAVTASITGKPTRLIESTQKNLGPELVPDHVASRLGQRALVLVVALGAVAVALFAPLLGPMSWLGESQGLDESWGARANEAQVLTLAAGGVLGSVMLGFFLAPALRKPRRRGSSRTERRKRSLGFVLPALMGLVFYLLYEFLV